MNEHKLKTLLKNHWADKKAGVKHQPLHTLNECYAEAGISYQKYAKFCAKYPGAPKPKFTTAGKRSNTPIAHYVKKDVLAFIEACRKAEGELK